MKLLSRIVIIVASVSALCIGSIYLEDLHWQGLFDYNPCMKTPRFGESAIETARNAQTKTVKALFLNEDYKALDELGQNLSKERKLFPNGTTYLFSFFRAFTQDNLDLKNDWGNLEGKVLAWRSKYPDSIIAQTAYVTMLIDRAWAFRGNGYASTVKEENWVPFNELLERAQREYVAGCKYKEHSPELAKQGLVLAFALAWDADTQEKTFVEAIQRNPEYFSLYSIAYVYHRPRWGGTARSGEKFLRKYLTKDSKFDRKTYAMVMLSVPSADDELYMKEGANWQDVVLGMHEILATCPEDRDFLNDFAKIAERLGDYTEANWAFEHLDSVGKRETWGNLKRFANARDRAYVYTHY